MLQYTDKTKNLIYQTTQEEMTRLSHLLYSSLSAYQNKYSFKFVNGSTNNTYIAFADEDFNGTTITVTYVVNHGQDHDYEFINTRLIIDNKAYVHEEHKEFHKLEPLFTTVAIFTSLTKIFETIKGDLQ